MATAGTEGRGERPVRRSAVALLTLALVAAATVGCTDRELDEDTSPTVRSTLVPADPTTTGPAGNDQAGATSTTEAGAVDVEPSEPADAGSSGGAGAGAVTIVTGSGLTRTIALASCASTGGDSLEIDGHDDAGNRLELKAADGTGAMTLRGGDQDLEGVVDRLDVDGGGGITASGRLEPATSGGQVGSFRLEGSCRD